MARLTERRKLIPGTTGWTVHDLDDPRLEAEWEASHFEIIEGVLATMPPAYWETSEAPQRLVRQVQDHLESCRLPAGFGFEVDVVVGQTRVPKADAVYMSDDDLRRQLAATRRKKKPKGIKYGRLCVPPTLVIENVSKGHESDDRVVKRRFYAEAGIPNYWILDVYERSLECLALDRPQQYTLDQIGRGKGKVSPRCFPGLTIDLARIWHA